MLSQMPLPPFSIALVNYKTVQLTSACLELLKGVQTDYGAEIWVVDNDSADESTAYLRSLDWIHLIERKPTEPETGAKAHGEALNIVLERVDTEFLFLLHTDTLIYDKAIFNVMLEKCIEDNKIMAVGCTKPQHRGMLRSGFRFTKRFLSHYLRHLKKSMGLKSKEPGPYREAYLQSFCALWNIKILKEHGIALYMNNRLPGYEAQDKLSALGYKTCKLSAKKVFSYLEHVDGGTLSAIGVHHKNHRRTKRYLATLERLKTDD